MAKMHVKLQNFAPLQKKLQTMATDAAKNIYANVTFGYGALYALFVHENLASFHPNGQAKYLEQPMREMQRDIPKIIANSMRQQKDKLYADALHRATETVARRVFAASQALVPVKTGRLKASGFFNVRKGKAK